MHFSKHSNIIIHPLSINTHTQEHTHHPTPYHHRHHSLPPSFSSWRINCLLSGPVMMVQVEVPLRLTPLPPAQLSLSPGPFFLCSSPPRALITSHCFSGFVGQQTGLMGACNLLDTLSAC